VKLLRCRICGETYLGTNAPSRCPFCGAEAVYFVPTEEFDETVNRIAATELERDDLHTAIELERSNARFYAGLGRLAGNPKLANAYKRLAAIEAEHCSVFCKLVDEPKPADLLDPENVSDDWCANIAESLKREQRASAFYTQASGRATNERVREVLAAVSAVELDHIAVDGLASGLAGC
jgi:rubrerythrin